MLSKTTYLCGALAGLLLCGGAAQAQNYYDRGETIIVPGARIHQHNDIVSARVSYSDLDLSRARDYRRLESRVSYTASRVCEVVKGTDRWTLMESVTCVKSAVRGAMAQVPRGHTHRMAYVAPAAPIFED